MELVDVTDSKSVGGDTVRVRLPPPAPRRSKLCIACSVIFKNQSALTPLFYFSGPFESKFCSNNRNDLIDNCCGTIHMHAENNNDNNKRQAQQGTVCSHSFCQNIFRHGICNGRTECHTEQQIVHAKGMKYILIDQQAARQYADAAPPQELTL